MAHRNIDGRRASVYWTLAWAQRPLNWSEIQALARLHGCSTSAIRADVAALARAFATYRPRLPSARLAQPAAA